MDAPEIYEGLCKDLTEETVSGEMCTPNEPTYDHIFLNGEMQVRRYCILSPEALSEMSEHYPIFVDTDIL